MDIIVDDWKDNISKYVNFMLSKRKIKNFHRFTKTENTFENLGGGETLLVQFT